MKVKKFDVVELVDNNKATILEIKEKEYLAEIVNPNGTTLDNRNITKEEIRKIVYTKQKGLKL